MNLRYLAAIIITGVCSLSAVGFAGDAAPAAAPIAPPVPPPAWHGDAAFGLSLARGNSDTLLANASATAHREWTHQELKLGIDGAYGLNNWGKTNETSSADSLHGVGDYKYLFSERGYGDARVDGFYDWIAKVHYRVIVGPAAGYFFIKSPNTRLSGEVGPTLIYDRVGTGTNVTTGGHMTLRITERFEHSFSKTSKVWEQIDYYPKVDDFNNYLVNGEVGAEAALNTRLSLRIVFADKFNSRPSLGSKENDLTLVSSVVYKY